MTKPKSSRTAVLAGQYINITEGCDEEYWWIGEPGRREGRVIKTDRFGQSWELKVKSTHWVTFRVAAGLLEVTVPTIHSWVREGKIATTKKRFRPAPRLISAGRLDLSNFKRAGVSVIPMKEVERLAEARGIFIRTPLTPQQKRALKGRVVTMKRKKGGETDADKG